MSLSTNDNAMEDRTDGNLTSQYAKLAKSTERLASGLRIIGSTTDTADLAIREMMRADLTTIWQGIRNTNNAICMLQTADGALEIIDDMLFRMHELALRAASPTYTSTQRAVINTEFQQLANEIERIAKTTDCNGFTILAENCEQEAILPPVFDDHLYNTSSSDEINNRIPDSVIPIHFSFGNDSNHNCYYINTQNVTLNGLGLGDGTSPISINSQKKAQQALKKIDIAIAHKDKIRAYFAAMQNRLENTLATLQVQYENLQTAQFRISDSAIATEMMTFVHDHILSQNSIAILSKDNLIPLFSMRLLG